LNEKNYPVYLRFLSIIVNHIFTPPLKSDLFSQNTPPPLTQFGAIFEVGGEGRILMTDNKKTMRDKKGRFVKGHKPLVRPKYDLMRKFPMLYCNTCHKGMTCPEYQEGFVCAHKKGLRRYKTRDIHKLIDFMACDLDYKMGETQYKMIVEVLSEKYSPELTTLISRNCKRLFLMAELKIQQERSRTIKSPVDIDLFMPK
jgi:hypothetical protein